MNRDDITRMAREAGYVELANDSAMYPPDFFERFAALVAAAEREACAKLCLETEPFYGVMFAEAIRARGEK
jgi:hypothetical protein